MTVRRGLLAVVLPWLAALLVFAGAAHQAAVALGWPAIGNQPGEWAPGEGYLVPPALLVLALLGFALPAAGALAWEVPATPVLALAAACMVVARFFTYDAYYAPTLRRMSDGGAVAGTWIVVVVACALGSALLALRWSRTGLVATGLVCWLGFGTTVAAGLH